MSPSGPELLRQVKSQIEEVDPSEVKELARRGRGDRRRARAPKSSRPATCRAPRHVPRSYLESRIEGVVPDRSTQVILYCAVGPPLGLRRRAR